MTTWKFSLAAVMTTMVVLGSSTRMMGADWPSFRGPAHDGKSAEAVTWPKDCVSFPRLGWRSGSAGAIENVGSQF